MDTFALLQQLKPEILAIAARHGTANIRVFGSVARGEASESSDIDFLVSMAQGRSLYDLIGFQQEVEAMLGRKADVLTENALNPYLKAQILQEALPL